jgi:hypothetical protein
MQLGTVPFGGLGRDVLKESALMNPRNGAALVGAAVLTMALAAPVAAQPAIEVVAEGLEAPRGLAITPNGDILVAEAGTAGDFCPQGEAGFCMGPSGAVTRISGGTIERILESLPSAGSGPEVVGPSDVAAIDDDSYYLVLNFGGDPAERPEGDISGWLLMVDANGNIEPVADVAGFEASDDPDAEYSSGVPDANPHSIAIVGDGVLVADAGSNALLKAHDSGAVSLVALLPPTMHEFSPEALAAMGPPPETDGQMAPEGEALAEGADMAETPPAAGALPAGGPPEMVAVPIQSVPTTVVVGPDRAYYVGELTGGPFPVGGASVYRVQPDGTFEVYATGFTNIMDIGFGRDGTLYVAEIVHDGLMGVFAGEAPPVGAVMSVAAGGGVPQVVATGEQLMALGGMVVADDGSIYVTANTMTPGGGTVLKITP